MPWYKAGTVNVTLNSNAVIGTGTAFIANSRVGDAFRGPDGGWYEVTNIASDTALAIDPPYQGATDAAGVYALAPMQGYVKDSADSLRALVNQFGGVLAVLGDDPTQAGVRAALNLTNADGVPQGETNKYLTNSGVIGSVLTGLDPGASGSVVATDSVVAAFSKLKVNVDALQAEKAGSGVNADITELNALTKPITPAQGGVSSEYIGGLMPRWVTASSVTLSTGSAYVPGVGRPVVVTSEIALSGLSLSANTWYYLYLYEVDGIPSAELVTTAPSSTYSGSARTKSADASRRYICALRTDGSGGLWHFTVDSMGMINYDEGLNVAPFAVLLAGTAGLSATAVSCSAMVPSTTTTVKLVLVNTGTPTMVIYAANNNSQSIFSIAPGTRVSLITLTNSSRTLYYGNSSSSGASAYIYIHGYGMDR